MENSPGSLIEKEEKGDQIEEKDMVDQEEVSCHHSENSTPVQSPGSLIGKEEKGCQVEEKDKFDQEDVGSHHWENSTPVQSPGSLIEKEEKGWNVEEKDKFHQKEVDFHHLHTTSISDSISAVPCPCHFPCPCPFRFLRPFRFLPCPFPFRFYFRHEGTERMQKMRLLKRYGLLKEELNWPDIISIADDLYTDGHIQWCEMVKIQSRLQPRRKAIDILLKVVLGNASSVSAFMKIMESKSTLSYIAKRINMTKVSAEEKERFRHLEKNQQGQRQNIYQVPSQKIQSGDLDFCFLLCDLYEKDVIDQMSDILLSNFFISISDHTEIVECIHLDGKILTLTDLMKKCPDDVYDVFVEVLTKNNMQYVLESLERNRMPNMKRKHWSIDLDVPTLQKRAKFEVSTSDEVEKIACGLRIAPARQKLENEASKHLDLELKEAFWGSMGLMFSFKVGRPSQKLKQAFA